MIINNEAMIINNVETVHIPSLHIINPSPRIIYKNLCFKE